MHNNDSVHNVERLIIIEFVKRLNNSYHVESFSCCLCVQIDSPSTAAVLSSSASVVQPVRVRVKSTSSLQHPQPIVAHHIVIPPPASVPSHRRSTSSLSSTPPTPAAADTLMPACPTGWARFDMSPLNEVTQDTAPSSQTADDQLPSSDVEPQTSEVQAHDFATFPPSSSVEDDQHVDHPATAEGQMSNDKFSDSFLASRDSTGFEDDVNQSDSAVVASSSFELMSPSSDKDSISLPSPEAPPPPLPANVPTAELPSEPPLPPPRPRAQANGQVGPGVEHRDVSLTPPSSARSESVHSSPVRGSPAPAAVCDSQSAPVKPPVTTVSSGPSQRVSSTTVPQSRFTVQPSSVQMSVSDAEKFSLVFPSDDATPPPLPPRNIPVSSDLQKQQLMLGISLPASGKLRSVDDVPPPPPPRRSLSKPVPSSRPVDPFAPIQVAVVVSVPVSVPARQQVAVTQALSSNCPVVETTIAPLPRPRPHLRQTETAASDAAPSTVRPTSSGSSSPWPSTNTPPITEPLPVDPFSNVDPFAGSVSPDDPFAEPSLDGMLSDLCHDFDTDTLSLSAFRTRAVTIDSVSSDVYDSSSVASGTRHRNASSPLDVSRSTVSPALPQTTNIDSSGTGCLVDLNTTDDVDTAKWQPFSEGIPGFALYGDLEDVWYSGTSVDWKPTSQPSDHDIFESSVSSTEVRQRDDALTQMPADGILDTAACTVSASEPVAGTGRVTVGSLVMTDTETNHCSLTSITSSSTQRTATDFAAVAAQTVHAVTEAPTGLSQSASSTEHADCSSEAVFGEFGERFTSSPAACVAAGVTTDVTVSSVTCSSELWATSTAPPTDNDKQQNSSITADLPYIDAQVIAILMLTA